MALPNILQTGRSGMTAAKSQMGTTSHNIANANTEGFSRQRINQRAEVATAHGQKNLIGSGTQIERTERINDSYLEKQLRGTARDLGHFEEKDLLLSQAESVFNEMGGEGLNRLVAKFFNDFRRLSNEPESEAIRNAVVESSQAMVRDFRRIRTQMEELRSHIDSRVDGFVREINSQAVNIKDLNLKIKNLEQGGASANDLKDDRDRAIRRMGELLDVAVIPDQDGALNIDIKGVGPLVNGPTAERLTTERTAKDDEGKPENSLTIRSTASAAPEITHAIKGGRLGALVEIRDKTISQVLDKLDGLASQMIDSVNSVHASGFDRTGETGILFFKPISKQMGAAQNIALTDEISRNPGKIAAAAEPDSPGDNRVALSLSEIQNLRLMGNGESSMDDYYNSIVSEIGILAESNKSNYNQQKDVHLQLNKIRNQISGVSLDEETANLMQFQHAYGASAKVIQVADEMLDTVLSLKR